MKDHSTVHYTMKQEYRGIRFETVSHETYTLCVHVIGQLCGRPLQVETTSLSSGGEARVEFLMEEKLSPKLGRHIKLEIPQLSSHIKHALYPSSISKKMNYNVWDPSSNIL
jgi:hypothetical protein